MTKPLFPLWIVGSCVLMILGAVTPWATAPGDTFGGLEGGGALVPILGIPAILAGAMVMLTSKRPRPRWGLIVCVLAGLLCAFITLYNWVTVEDILDSPLLEGSGIAIGWGLVLCSLASVSLVLASFTGMATRRKEAPAPVLPE